MNIRSILAVAAATILAASCNSKKEEEKPLLPDYKIVKLEKVSRKVEYCFPATLTGLRSVNLFPQVEGRIMTLHYRDGDFVKKGDPLVEIDPTQFRLRAEAARASVQAAEAAMATAKLQYESQSRLFEKKIVSEYVMKTALNSYQTAQANVAQAKAQLSNALTDLSHCTVVAPITGVLASKHDDIGLLVSASMPEPILTITDQTTIKARFSITETQFSSLFRNMDLVPTKDGYRPRKTQTDKSISSGIKLRLKDGILYDKEGEFYNIGGTIDASTGTVVGVIAFDNPDLFLHSGNSATVIFTDSLSDVIVLPQTACKKLQDKYLVYKADKTGCAVGVVVDVIPTNDGKEYIIADDKLKPGDEIVADGVARIQEGQRIK